MSFAGKMGSVPRRSSHAKQPATRSEPPSATARRRPRPLGRSTPFTAVALASALAAARPKGRLLPNIAARSPRAPYDEHRPMLHLIVDLGDVQRDHADAREQEPAQDELEQD